jgi:uncharacterized membrane-anchored protein
LKKSTNIEGIKLNKKSIRGIYLNTNYSISKIKKSKRPEERKNKKNKKGSKKKLKIEKRLKDR